MKETRNAALNAATDTNEAGGMILTGTPIVFDQPTTINTPDGSYTEIIAAGALDGCDLSDSRLLWAHDDKRVPLARTPKTMSLTVDSTGLHMVATLPDTEEARSVYEAVRRRDVQGMSFAFVVAPGGDTWSSDGTTRTINKISKVLEVSAVNFPAYPTASIEARAARQATQRQAAARRNAILMANIIISKTI
nr:MAG TPA: prohead serine protease [Caudoviricetes sp.]